MKLKSSIFAGTCSLIVAWGCASQPKNNPDATYSEIKQAELSQERREFIRETQAELEKVDKEMGLTQAKLEHESQYVTAEQRAEWSQQMFELKQERQRLNAEVSRAETVNEAEWEEMRGPLGVAVDSLQAGVTKVGNTVASAFEPKPKMAANEGLCSLRVAKVDAKVAEEASAVVVDVTVTEAPASVPALRNKALELARNTAEYGPTNRPRTNGGQATASSKELIPVALATQNIDNGVRVTFTPNATQLDALQERLAYDAKVLNEDRCAVADSSQASATLAP
jgi:hypothetical protein